MAKSKFPSLLLGVLLVAAVAACGGASDTASRAKSKSGTNAPLSDLLPDSIRSQGVVPVASSIDYPPFEMFSSEGEITGFDYDLAQAMEPLLGVKMEFHDVSYDGIIPGLASGRYVMAISGISDTSQRRKAVHFVDYISAGGAILVPEGNPENIHTLSDLCGHTLAVNVGATGEEDAVKQKEECTAQARRPLEIRRFQGQGRSLAVKTGRVDAALMDASAAGWLARKSDKLEVGTKKPYDPEPYGMAFPKTEQGVQLAKAIKAALERLMDNGTYERILSKYGLANLALEEPTVNNGQGF